VTVTQLDFLRNVSLIIEQQPPRTVQNYMVWRFMMKRVRYMPKRFRAIKQTFDRVFEGIRTEPSRSITCAIYVNGNMGFAVSKLYINKYFDKNARNQVSNT
jgi:predicted metalloendopeptidase